MEVTVAGIVVWVCHVCVCVSVSVSVSRVCVCERERERERDCLSVRGYRAKACVNVLARASLRVSMCVCACVYNSPQS